MVVLDVVSGCGAVIGTKRFKSNAERSQRYCCYFCSRSSIELSISFPFGDQPTSFLDLDFNDDDDGVHSDSALQSFHAIVACSENGEISHIRRRGWGWEWFSQ